MDKYIEYVLADAKFVAGQDELNYKEVLDDFENAKYINVLTYNISSKQDELVTRLKKVANRDTPIRVITNIPNRWEHYYSGAEKKAKNSIQLYIKKLDPEKLGKMASVFFRFDNHAKIIMTNNVIYWGSANFSEESQKNYECGTISRDKGFIDFIQNAVIPSILDESVDYYEGNYPKYIAGIYNARAYLHNIREELHDCSYGYYETRTDEKEYFDIDNNYITWRQLEDLIELMQEISTKLEEFTDEVDYEKYPNLYEKHERIAKQYNECFEKFSTNISDLCYDIEDMARYDVDDSINDILQDEYAMEAYEENLEYCIEQATDKARDTKHELVEEAEESIKELLNKLSECEYQLTDFAKRLICLANEDKEVNSLIDNTSIE